MRCEIIAVGSELLSFARSETNSLFLASRLLPLGFQIRRKSVVADSEPTLIESLELALEHADLVLLTGGLGPTNDDITREAVASCLGRSLREEAGILTVLEQRYQRIGLRMTENNRRQAQVPEGARVLANPLGTAPGLMLTEGGRLVILLPGPPRELGPMMDEQVLPLIREHFAVSPAWMRRLKVGGEAESRVDAAIEGIYRRYSDVETTILSSPGVISLYFSWRGPSDAALAEVRLDELVQDIRQKLGPSVYSDREESLAEALGGLLRERHLSVATAESCTGGWIAKLLTDVPGSSAYFRGSIVVYANSVKESLLAVNPKVLEREGAVSGPTAEMMAAGVRERLGADLGISATGIAGPDGGSEEKPVGTVFLGLCHGKRSRSRKLWLPGDREAVRLRTCNLALDWMRREIQ